MSEEKNDSFDEFIYELQDQIRKNERKKYSKKVLEEFNNPQNLGILNDPNGIAKITGPCGDTVEIYLKVDRGKINQVSFMTDGCGATIACGSMITKMVKGKQISEASNITEEDLIKALDGLPEDNEHCAKLLVNTMKVAILDFRKKPL
jgi:nitrogen fixation NifU-like protein